MAKTGGTTVNGYLAAHYERVCGNKGRSYNAFPYNILRNGTEGGRFNGISFHQTPLEDMGWEDCDFISHEKGSKWWMETFSSWNMEMHVPCRDPVDHLMSMCNHRNKIFNCQAEDLDGQINHCFLPSNKRRFDKELTNQTNFEVKCFSHDQLAQYLNYMGGILQKRRLEVNYVKRLTNQARNKEEECIWKNPSLEEQVRSRLLKTYDYYTFCQECLNSDNNLLRGG